MTLVYPSLPKQQTIIWWYHATPGMVCIYKIQEDIVTPVMDIFMGQDIGMKE